MFPSPCGEKVGINSDNLGIDGCVLLMVSVPLRGKGRDQHRYLESAKRQAEDVSVPLRGKGRDQQVVYVNAADWETMFPSPCGEKVGINCRWLKPSGFPVSCFRPLAGKR